MTNRAKTFGNKRQLAVIITVATFFFVFLGMRIPYIKGDFHKPKQRPRAVAENIGYPYSMIDMGLKKTFLDHPHQC